MKFKIVILTCFCIFINSTFGYCEEISSEVQIANHVSEIVSDDGNIYFDEYGRVTRSATGVAIAGSVASTILSLAVKSGIIFGTVKGMDEFLHRFLNVPESESIIKALGEKALSSIGGLITIGRDLLNSIGDVFNDIYIGRDITTLAYDGFSLPFTDYGRDHINGNVIKQLGKVSTFGLYVSPISPSSEKRFIVNGTTYIFTTSYSVDVIDRSTVAGKLQYISKTSGELVDVVTCSIMTNPYAYVFPYVFNYPEKPVVGIGMLYKANAGDSYTGTTFKNSYHILSPPMYEYKVETSIGSAWSSGAIKGDDGTTNSNVSIKVPTDLGVLVGNKDSGSIGSSPTYDYWIPGKPVTYPSTDDVTTSPPRVDIVVPDVEVDSPGDTEDPPIEDDSGDSSLWDWLKKLIQKIIDLITSIWNWLTTFWEKLLEFLLSLIQQLFFVDETYWSDKVTDLSTELEGKYPVPNIDKIKDIAVGEKQFKDIKATFFGVEGVVVRASVVNRVISWARPILQGFIALFLLLYNYSQLYKIIRGGSLVHPSEHVENISYKK